MDNFNMHLYTLDATGFKMKSKIFLSRQEAKAEMYRLIDKNGLQIVKKYDDNHFKTYICSNDARFYINRIA